MNGRIPVSLQRALKDWMGTFVNKLSTCNTSWEQGEVLNHTVNYKRNNIIKQYTLFDDLNVLTRALTEVLSAVYREKPFKFRLGALRSNVCVTTRHAKTRLRHTSRPVYYNQIITVDNNWDITKMRSICTHTYFNLIECRDVLKIEISAAHQQAQIDVCVWFRIWL